MGFCSSESQKFPNEQYVPSIAHHLKQAIHSQMRKDGFLSSSPPPSMDLPSSLQLSGHFKKEKKKKVYFWGRKVCHMLIIKLSINRIRNRILLGSPFISCWGCNQKCLLWAKHSEEIYWHSVWLLQWGVTTKMVGLTEHSMQAELNPTILLTLEELAFSTTENWPWAHVDPPLEYKIDEDPLGY